MTSPPIPANAPRVPQAARSGFAFAATVCGFILLSYWAAWHVAAWFEVKDHLSALYPLAGLSLVFPMVLGWRALPVTFAAIAIVPVLSWQGIAFSQMDVMGSLRQCVVYGVAGLYLRQFWTKPGFRFDQLSAVRFVVIALASTLASAYCTLWLAPYSQMDPTLRANIFLAFWGGDFVGVILVVPIALGLRGLVLERRSSSRLTFIAWIASQTTTLGTVVGLLLAAGVIGLWVLLGWLEQRLPELTHAEVLLLPVVLCLALQKGAAAAVAGTLGLLLLATLGSTHLQGPLQGPVIDLQLLLATAAAVALLAGASHDDVLFETWRANHDALTGLANRSALTRALETELARSQRLGTGFVLMYLDLDRFKAVNDSLGHAAGDQLLCEAATRLRSAVRATDLVARLGGDEFAIVLRGNPPSDELERLARDIIERINHPFSLPLGTASVGVSAGIAIYPRDGEDQQTLERQADAALYRSKALGRNQSVLAANLT